jgi:hypothetical protein
MALTKAQRENRRCVSGPGARHHVHQIESLGGIDVKSLKDVKAQLLAKPVVRQAYDAQAPEFELARELIAARTKAGLIQGDVAARIASSRGTPSK